MKLVDSYDKDVGTYMTIHESFGYEESIRKSEIAMGDKFPENPDHLPVWYIY